MKFRSVIIAFCVAILLVPPGFVVLPSGVGQAQAALFGEFSLKDEMDMGRQFEVMIKSQMPLIEDPEVKLYVQAVVDSIVATLAPQPYKFQTNVLLHPAVNAFATPGGFVFVHTGLIQHLKHESELAGVLAHEIAHVTQRHIARRMERGQLISVASLLGAVLGAVAGGGSEAGGAVVVASAAAGHAAMLNYSRTDESDADQFGIQYLVAAGYNPTGLGGAFRVIQEQSFGRGKNYPSYLSTHPDISERMTGLSARIQSLDPAIVKRPQKDGMFHRVQTIIWARYGDPAHAEQIFNTWPASDPMAHLGKGMLHSRLNRVRDAEADFTKALRLAPRDPLILREAGTFHYIKGDFSLARAQLDDALTLDPNDYMGLFFQARLLDDLGDSEGAQERYRRVLRYVPEDVEVHTYYGRSLGKSGLTFSGYLHLAYAALYSNDERRVKSWIDKAKAVASTSKDKAELELFEERFKVRTAIIKKAS